MQSSVDRNWWKKIFDEIYLLTDSRSVGDEYLTRKEVDFIISWLKLDPSQHILDLCCGQGRHSLELARRGYRHITGLDYSTTLLDRAKKQAEKENLPVRYIRGDARETRLPANSFHRIILMASSFGYFIEEEENYRILKEIFRLLKGPGRVLLDLPDRDYCMENFHPVSKHKVNEEISVTRERTLEKDTLFSRESVYSKEKGLIRRSDYCIRLYKPENISRLLVKAGFSRVECNNGFMDRGAQGDFGCMTNRMVVTAEKKS